MGMAEALTQLTAEHRQEFADFREEIKGVFQQIRDEHEKFAKTNEELREEQEQEIYEKSEQAKHDKYEAASERKIGVAAEEPESDKPRTREARDHDSSTRSIAASHQDEEEPEPYRRPERWHDQNNAGGGEPSNTLSRGVGWGGSTRRIGNYHDEDDD